MSFPSGSGSMISDSNGDANFPPLGGSYSFLFQGYNYSTLSKTPEMARRY